MKPEKVRTWTNQDFLDAKCGVHDIGKPASPPIDADVLDELPPMTMAELKQAALRVARGSLGFDDFLKKYPAFHHKLLLSMVKVETAPPAERVIHDVPWLTSDRLAYGRPAPPPLEVIENVAWKDASQRPDPETQELLDSLK